LDGIFRPPGEMDHHHVVVHQTFDERIMVLDHPPFDGENHNPIFRIQVILLIQGHLYHQNTYDGKLVPQSLLLVLLHLKIHEDRQILDVDHLKTWGVLLLLLPLLWIQQSLL